MLKIFVEGKSDKVFIECLIESRLKKRKDADFEVLIAGGWTALTIKNNKRNIEKFNDAGYKVLVIFDADSEPEGGFEKRHGDILKKKNENSLEFEIFLFPDNKSDGDYQLLLEQIVSDKHKEILRCFESYESCLESLGEKQQFSYTSPLRKSKIYAYVDAFPKSSKKNEKFKKGDYFFHDDSMWNLKSRKLDPLVDFINRGIKSS